MPDVLDWSYAAADIPESGLAAERTASEEERSAIASALDLLACERLESCFEVQPLTRGRYLLRGTLVADVAQSCVVTLDPVESQIDEPIDAVFVPEGSKLALHPVVEGGEMLLDPDGPDSPEVFHGDTIDVGVAAAEYAALAIDPYPRKAGVVFSGHTEHTDEGDRKPSPFAVLKDWKKD